MTATPTTTTTYTVTATDANGCVVTDNHTITANTPATVSVSAANNKTILCTTGASSATSTTLNASGAASYVWSTGATTSSISVSAAGTYTVTGTDPNGCTSSANIGITPEAAPTVTITSSTGSLNTCGSNTIDLSASASGPTGITYTYAWANGPSTSNYQNVSGSSQGTTYTLSATSSSTSGCVGTNAVQVTNTTPNTVTITGGTSFCSGNTGSVQLVATSGFTNYTWTGGPVNGTGAAVTAQPTTTTTYTLTATDANGCIVTDDHTIAEVTPQTVSIQATNNKTILCSTGNTSATSTTLSAIPNSGLIYSWSTGATSQNITVNGAGIYTVTTSDNNGCIDQQNITVTIEDAPQVTVTSSTNKFYYCQNNQVINLTGAVSNNTNVNYNFTWTRPNGLTTSGNVLSNLNSDGVHELNVTSQTGSGCQTTINQNISLGTAPSASVTGSASYCQNTSNSLTANYTTNYSYSWDVPTGVTPSSNTDNSQSTTLPGQYSVVVTDQLTGCATASNPINVIQNSNPSPSITAINNKTIICNSVNNLNSQAEKTTLQATQGFSSYAWNSAASGISQTTSGANNGHLFEINSGDYSANSETFSVTVIDANGCVGISSQFQISKETATPISITSSSPYHCSPSPTILSAGTNSAISYSIDWYSNAGLTNLLTSGSQLSISMNPGITEDFYAVATSMSGSGCSSSTTYSITSVEKPAIVLSGTNVICLGTQQQGLIQSSVSPANPVVPITGYIYEWTTPGITTVANTPDLQITQGGQYTLKVTDPTSQCSSTATKTVQEFAQATMAITGPTRVCVGDVVTLTATPSNAQTANYLYTISHDNNVVWTTSNQYVFTATATSGGVYEANGVHTNTCITTPVSHTITVASAPNVTVGSSGLNANGQAYTTANLCLENGNVSNNVTLSSNVSGTSSNYTYQWYSGAASSITNATSNIYNPTVGGTYFVKVTNPDGCFTESTPIIITASAVHAASITGDLTPCTNSNPQLNGLQAIATPPGTNYAYQWKINGSNANQLSNQEFVFSAGYVNSPPPVSTGLNTYTVRVTNPNTGCWVDDSEVVTYVDPPSISITGPSTLCAGGTVILTAGGASPLTYEWYFKNPNSTSPAFVALPAPKFTAQSVSVSDAGEYKLKVQDPNSSCENEDILTLALMPSVGVTVAPTNSNKQTICLPNGTVSLTATVAVPGVYTYTWYKDGGTVVAGPSQNQLTHIANTTGNYHLEVFNASMGCTEVSNVFAVNSETLPTVVLGGPTSICGTGNIVVTSAVNSTPSNPDYDYEWYRDNLPLTTATAQSVSNLSTNQAGSYVVKAISKTSGCSASSQPWVVSLGAGSTVNLTANSSQYCSTGNITITANPINTGLYDFTWSSSQGTDPGVPNTPQTALSTGSITVSTPDTYFVTVTNNTTGCTSNNSIVVSPANINATTSFNPDSILCDGESTSINVIPSTAGFYNIRLYQGIVNSSALVQEKLGVQNASFTNISNAGTYYAVIESANNVSCGVTKTVNITAGSTTPFTLTPGKQVLCTGESTTITAIPNIPGNYLYEWQNSSSVIIGTSSVLSVSTGGDYTLKLTNSQGCTSEDDITIVADNQLQVTITNLDPNAPPYLCAANGSTLAADVIPNDPNQTYLWEWIKDTTYAVGFSQNLTVLDSGIYHVEVVNENGCRYESTPIYMEDRRPVVSYLSSHPNNTVCAGQDLELNFSATPSSSFDFYGTTFNAGATGNPYVKNASPITNCNTCVISTNLSQTGNGGGTYIIKATSGNGCVTEEIITVTVNELPSFTVTTPLEYCQFSASDQLFIETQFTNFTGATGANGASQGSYAPRWYTTPDTSAFLGNSPKPSTDSVGTKTYFVQVENTTTGCLSTFAPVEVNILQSPTQPTLTSPLIACENASRIPAVSNLNDVNSDYNVLKTITLASNQTALSAAQGSGNYRSVWFESDTATEIDLSASQNKIIPDLSSPDTLLYFVSQFSILTTDNGCPSKKLAVPVYVAAKPSFSILSENGQFSVCQNDSLELSIQTPVNGTTYEWIEQPGVPSIPAVYPYVYTNPTGSTYLAHSNKPIYETYWVRAVDSNQCFRQKSVTVNQIALPVNNIGYAPTSLDYCFGADAQELQVSTEVGSLTALWYDNTTNEFLGDSIVPNTFVAPSTSTGTSFKNTTYKFKLKNQMTGCVSELFRTVDVKIHQLPDAPIIASDWTTCYGDDMTVPSYKTLSTSLLNPMGLTFKWYDSDTNLLSSGAYKPSSLRTDTIEYFVSRLGPEPLNCESNLSTVLAYTKPLPIANLVYSDPDRLICYGQDFHVQAILDTVNSSYNFEWTEITGTVFQPLPEQGLYLSRNIIEYSEFAFNIEDAQTGCQNTLFFDVDVYPVITPPTAPATPAVEFCQNDTNTLQFAPTLPGYEIQWLDALGNVFAGNPVAANEAIGDVAYQVRHLDTVTGCFSTAVPYVVNVKERPAAPNLVEDWLACLGELDPDGIQEGIHFELPVGVNHSVRIYNGDSLTILNQFPQPSTNLVDTSIYYLSSLLAYPNLQCESARSVALRAITLPLPVTVVAISDSDQVVCMDQILTLSVNDTVGSGNTYVWSVDNDQNGIFDAMGNGLQQTYTVANAGPYQFRVTTTDLFGCVAQDYVNVTTHAVVTPPGSFINNYCYNQDSIRISANYPQNAIPAGYKLIWLDSNHNRLAIAPFVPTWLQPSNSNFINIPYLIEFKDTITGCYSEEVGVAAKIYALPPDPILLRDWATCYGEPNPLAINGNPLRPQIAVVGSNNFKWIGPDSASVLNSAPIPSTLRKDTVHYFVRTVSDINNNCESANMVAIQAYTFPLPQPIVAVSDSDRIVCRGEAIEFEVTDTTTNGWTYQWTKFDARVIPPIPAVPAVPGLGLLYQDSVTYNTQYELRTTDTNTCFSKKIWNITKADYPIVDSIIVKDITCYNTDDGEITIFSRFGQSLRYSLDSGATYTFRAKDTALEKGWYYVDVVDNFSNCPTIYHANDRHVYVHEPLPLKIDTVITQDITCFGLLDGQMQIVASGGYILDSTLFNYQKPEKLYSIDAGATLYLNDSLPGSTSSGMIDLAAGLYQIRVENVNGCQAINNQNYTITLNQPDLAYIDTIIVTPISCYNQTDGTIDVRAFGGNSLTYSIDSVQYFPIGLFNNLGSQAYFLEVVDSLGCLITPNSQSDSIWISEPAPLTVNPIVNQLLCYHDSTGLIELDIFGGNPNFQSYQYGYDIDWDVDTASLTIPINSSYYLPNNDSIYGLIAGTYYANIVDFKGCGIVVPIVVNEPDPVEVNSITIVPVSCYGFGDGRILVNATGGNYLEYELTTSLGVPPPSWQSNPLFTLLDSDTTFVTVRDSNACLVTYNTITKNFVPQPDSAFVDTIITHDILCFSDSTGSIFIKAFGGNSLTYSIDSVFTGTTFYPGLVADTFYVQVVDSKSCPVNYMNNDSIIILTEPPLLVLESNLVKGVTCYYDTTGQIGHLITGGVLPYTLVLNDLDTLTSTTLTTNLYGGPWYFTSYDANGCRDSSLVYIPTTDYDCDSIPDNIEGDTDFDFDGIPNMMDFDSDGDGIPDIVERDYNRDGIIYDDCDNDGWPDYLDTDQCNFFIPNILTPNGDGDNDFFVIPELDKYPNNRLSIYDRLGNLVFQQTSYINTFDGTANRTSALSTTNSQLPIDTYFYIVEVNGVSFQSGYIFIMR